MIFTVNLSVQIKVVCGSCHKELPVIASDPSLAANLLTINIEKHDCDYGVDDFK